MELVIGSKVRLLRAMLGEEVGATGYVVEEYKDFDGNGVGVSIIFKNKGFDGFSVNDQNNYLKHLEDVEEYSTYVWKGVNHVYNDYEKGYWKF